MSLVEALANVTVGFFVAVLTQRAVFPLFGIQTDWSVDFAMGGLFTLVSIVRSYIMRRLFERIAGRSRAAEVDLGGSAEPMCCDQPATR
jgi:hypothetical protein